MRIAAPTPKRPRVDTLPDFLKSSSYCLWRYEWVQEPGKDGRWNKTPYQASAPREKARVNDPATFSPLPFTWGVYQKNPEAWAGLGILMAGDMVGIDIDHCVDKSGKLSEMAQEIVDLMDSYTEISPSGSGIRIFTFVPHDFIYGDQYYKKNSLIGLEVYRGGETNRFLTVTGDRIREGTRATRGEQLQRILNKYMRKPEKPTKTTGTSVTMSPLSLDDQQIVDKALSSDCTFAALWGGDCSRYNNDHSVADKVLCQKIAFYTKDPAQIDRIFRRSGLMREKWDRKTANTTYGLMTIEAGLADQRESYNPVEYAKAKQEEEEKRIQQGIEKRQQAKARPLEWDDEISADSWEEQQAKNSTPEAEEVSRDSVRAFRERIQTDRYKLMRTGLSFIDDLIGGGLEVGTLSLLLAAPGAGKTALYSQLAESLAEAGNDVVYMNFEMTHDQMLARAISARLAAKGKSLSATDILAGYQWNDTARALILAEIDKYMEEVEPHLTYKTAGNTLGDLDSLLQDLARHAKDEQKRAPLVFLDYLHLIEPREGERIDDKELIKRTMKLLKRYAAENDTFSFAISATNRTSSGALGTITMQSGRDSSNLEYSADYIFGLNFYEIDSCMIFDEVSSNSIKAAEMAAKANAKLLEYQSKEWRRMALTGLKVRWAPTGASSKLYFWAKTSRFYASDDPSLPEAKGREPFPTGENAEAANLDARQQRFKRLEQFVDNWEVIRPDDRAEVPTIDDAMEHFKSDRGFSRSSIKTLIDEYSGLVLNADGTITPKDDIIPHDVIEKLKSGNKEQ